MSRRHTTEFGSEVGSLWFVQVEDAEDGREKLDLRVTDGTAVFAGEVTPEHKNKAIESFSNSDFMEATQRALTKAGAEGEGSRDEVAFERRVDGPLEVRFSRRADGAGARVTIMTVTLHAVDSSGGARQLFLRRALQQTEWLHQEVRERGDRARALHKQVARQLEAMEHAEALRKEREGQLTRAAVQLLNYKKEKIRELGASLAELGRRAERAQGEEARAVAASAAEAAQDADADDDARSTEGPPGPDGSGAADSAEEEEGATQAVGDGAADADTSTTAPSSTFDASLPSLEGGPEPTRRRARSRRRARRVVDDEEEEATGTQASSPARRRGRVSQSRQAAGRGASASITPPRDTVTDSFASLHTQARELLGTATAPSSAAQSPSRSRRTSRATPRRAPGSTRGGGTEEDEEDDDDGVAVLPGTADEPSGRSGAVRRGGQQDSDPSELLHLLGAGGRARAGAGTGEPGSAGRVERSRRRGAEPRAEATLPSTSGGGGEEEEEEEQSVGRSLGSAARVSRAVRASQIEAATITSSTSRRARRGPSQPTDTDGPVRTRSGARRKRRRGADATFASSDSVGASVDALFDDEGPGNGGGGARAAAAARQDSGGRGATAAQPEAPAGDTPLTRRSSSRRGGGAQPSSTAGSNTEGDSQALKRTRRGRGSTAASKVSTDTSMLDQLAHDLL